MARALSDFRRQFEKLQKLVADGTSRLEVLENNMGSYVEHLRAGATELGLRLQALAASGVQHAAIEPYLSDPVVARMIKEMSDTREMGKHAAVEAAALGASFGDIEEAAKGLQTALRNESTARADKYSNKALRINQSFRQMELLLAEVTQYLEEDQTYIGMTSFTGTREPGDFDQLYTRLVKQALTQSAQTARLSDQEARWMQSLAMRVLKSNQTKAQVALKALQQAGGRAEAAAKAGDKPALARAQKDGKLAHLKLKPIVEPYVAAMKNARVLGFLAQQRDKDEIRRRVQAITQYQLLAQQELTKMIARKV